MSGALGQPLQLQGLPENQPLLCLILVVALCNGGVGVVMFYTHTHFFVREREKATHYAQSVLVEQPLRPLVFLEDVPTAALWSQ